MRWMLGGLAAVLVPLLAACSSRPWGGHDYRLSLSYSDDGTRLASTSEKYGLYTEGALLTVWSLTSGDKLWSLKDEIAAPEQAIFSRDGSRVALRRRNLGKEAEEIRILDGNTGEIRVILSAFPVQPTALTFVPDGKHLLTGGPDGQLRLWDSESGSLVKTWGGHSERIQLLSFSPDGTRLMSSAPGGELKIWEFSSWTLLRSIPTRIDSVLCVALSADEKTLACSGMGKERGSPSTIEVWNLLSGDLLKEIPVSDHAVRRVCLSPDGSKVAVPITSVVCSFVSLWETSTGKHLPTMFERSYFPVTRITPSLSSLDIRFNSEGRCLLAGRKGNGMWIEIWDLESGESWRKLREPLP